MKSFLTTLFLLLSPFIFSQSKVNLSDKEFEELKLKVKLEIRNNIDSAYYYCNKIETSNNNLHKGFAYSYKAYYFQLKNDTISSNKYMEKAIEFIKKEAPSLKKYSVEIQLLNLRGLIDQYRGKWSKALIKFEEGKIISKKNNDQKQLIKFNNNIASINSYIGNINLAIASLKENNIVLEKFKYLYSKEDFFKSKSLINYNIGKFYLDIFRSKNELNDLELAEYYFKETLFYSDNLLLDKLKVINDLASIQFYKKNYELAEEYYFTSLMLAKENQLFNEQIYIKFNLGALNYNRKNYEKALVFFKEADSISYLHGIFEDEFVMSNYYQGKIYYLLKDYERGLFHLNIYSKEYKKRKYKLTTQTFEINGIISSEEANKDVELIKKVIEKKNATTLIWVSFILIVVLILIFIIVKIYLEKKKADKKVEKLVLEFKENKKLNIAFKIEQKINIDDEKEKEILEKLESLIDKKYFLNQEFNQQNVAKKIKTNTTYLSLVVNKNYGKSFSEYSNELKINYAIEELINNPTYRKYSTQAIAESVGFKNNVSFTKSFKKRAGVSPAQFILKIEERI